MRGQLERRTLVWAAGAALAATKLAAQTPASATIGVLSPFSPTAAADWHRALERGLQDLGWVRGNNLRIEYRHGMGDTALLPGLMADLLRLKIDLVVTEVTEATKSGRTDAT